MLTFDFFVAVNKTIVTLAYQHIEPQMTELREQRREALENYEDELFEDLVLQSVLLEQKAIENFGPIVYPEVDLRTRDLIKAKVRYLMDPEQNTKFEAELNVLKDSLKAAASSHTPTSQ